MRIAFALIGMVAAVLHWWTRLPTAQHGAGTSGSRSGVDTWAQLDLREKVETVTKVVATSSAIAIAATSDASTDIRTIVVVALVLCLVGDVALLAVVDRFVVGLAAFLVAHVGFVVAFLREGLHAGPRPMLAFAASAVVAVTVGRRILGATRRDHAHLAVPVAAYLVTILTMAVIGWSTRSPRVWVGVTSFVVSDSVLGWEEFVERRPLMPLAVMTTYHIAIFSLALSL